MAFVLEGMVYEWKAIARDLKSGKGILNTLYYRHGDGVTDYGQPIAGSNDATMENDIYDLWLNQIMPRLSVNYELTNHQMRAISGRTWPTPVVGIAGAIFNAASTVIVTTTPHGLDEGDAVEIDGVTTPVEMNGSFTVNSVSSPNKYTILVPFAAPYAGPGTQQKIEGSQRYTYSTNLEVALIVVGGAAGEATPNFVSVDMRRPSGRSGKNWRSRLSLSPISEAQQENGKLEATAYGGFVTAGAAIGTSGVAIGDGSNAYPVAVSKQLAFQQPKVFTQSATWSSKTTAWLPRPNTGSIVSRKPRLTTVIG